MFVSDRGKVIGGLPDVVTIMEKKVSVRLNTLSSTTCVRVLISRLFAF